MRMAWSAFSGGEYLNILSITRNLIILVIGLWALAMTIIRGRRTSCSVGHSKLSAGLGKSGPAMDPEHVVDYEGTGGLLSGRNGVQMMCMFMSGGLEEARGRIRSGGRRVVRRLIQIRYSPGRAYRLLGEVEGRKVGLAEKSGSGRAAIVKRRIGHDRA